jgi:1,4-alpha-glucan branching enzyme
MSTIASEQVRAGMGLLPHESGVAFRVWAPHANAVYVIGSFNNWSSDAHPMAKEEGGYWYADIASAPSVARHDSNPICRLLGLGLKEENRTT